MISRHSDQMGRRRRATIFVTEPEKSALQPPVFHCMLNEGGGTVLAVGPSSTCEGAFMNRLGIAVLGSVALVGAASARPATAARSRRRAWSPLRGRGSWRSRPRHAALRQAEAPRAVVVAVHRGPGASFTATVTGCTVGETVDVHRRRTSRRRSASRRRRPPPRPPRPRRPRRRTTTTTTDDATDDDRRRRPRRRRRRPVAGDRGGLGRVGARPLCSRSPRSTAWRRASLVAPTRAGLHDVVAVGATSGLQRLGPAAREVVTVPTTWRRPVIPRAVAAAGAGRVRARAASRRRRASG